MKTLIIILIIFAVFCAVLCYTCCIAAGRADKQSEYYWAEQQRKNLKK